MDNENAGRNATKMLEDMKQLSLKALKYRAC